LKGVDDNAVLEISYVGYEMLTISVNNRTSLVTSLKAKPENLNEIVIQKGYYTEKQRYTLGNSVHIDSKQIEKAPVQNPLLAIQGLTPGVEITQLTGMNGGGVKVRFGGPTTFISGQDPLIIIDGVPYPIQSVGSIVGTGFENIVQGGSPLNYINPNDIEAIDILKDADATSIYGSKAANGAILITTKKGRVGKTRLSLNIQQGWGKVGHFVDMMNTRQYLDMRYEALRNDGISLVGQTGANSNLYDLVLWDTSRYTNWQKTLIGGTAKYTNLNASISGGNNQVQYMVGGSYNRQTTVFPGDFDDKTGGLHFNISSSSANQQFSVNLTGSYMYDRNGLPGVDLTQQAVEQEPDAPTLFNPDGTINWAVDPSGFSSWNNPLAYTQNSDFANTTKNLVSNLQLNYRILTGLNFSSRFGYTNMQSDLYRGYRINYNPPELRPTRQRTANFGNRNMTTWNIEPQLQYSHSIGMGKMDGLIGTTIEKTSFSYLAIDASGFVSDLLMKTLTAATSTNIRQSLSGLYRFNAAYGRLGYTWGDKYLINLTARRDGSNKFGPKARFHNFASAGLGWIFTNEKWVARQLSFLSFGKLRATYGTTGNDQIPPFSYLSYYNIINPTVLYQNSIGLLVSNIPNPYLEWEKTRKWTGGIDLGFVKDRIRLGATYSLNRSSNQLTAQPLPSIAGFGNITKNWAASVQNTAWEFVLNAMPVKSKQLSWNISANLTIPRNKLLSYPGLSFASIYTKGQPLSLVKALHFGGLDSAYGNYVFLDVNGNPTYNPTTDDRTALISTLSRYYGGLVNTITYKAFQFDFVLQFVRKKGSRDMYFYNGDTYPGSFNYGTSNQPVSVANRWQKPGDMSIAPVYSTYNFDPGIKEVDAWYSNNASYVRLKNASISWQLPTIWLTRTKIHDVNLYVHGENLLTFTKYKGLDPETMSIYTLPPLRMITTGIKIGF
jgi:TonB-linked SusC/RagA family outer membrane protein